MISADQLRRIYPAAKQRADVFAVPLSEAMDEFQIDTPARQAAFLAQVGHESGQLRYVEEIASGQSYEWRTDLGNLTPGDGARFKGRGLIQITGRNNYKRAGAALLGDSNALLLAPARLAENDLACRSAAWFWQSSQLNELADAGKFALITRRINGGLNGQAERLALWKKAKEVLHVA